MRRPGPRPDRCSPGRDELRASLALRPWRSWSPGPCHTSPLPPTRLTGIPDAFSPPAWAPGHPPAAPSPAPPATASRCATLLRWVTRSAPAVELAASSLPSRHLSAGTAANFSTTTVGPHQQSCQDPEAAMKLLRIHVVANCVQEWLAHHPRWGFRRAYHAARAEGWYVNHRRLQGLWREEGACGCRSVAAANASAPAPPPPRSPTLPTGCGRWTYAWLRVASLVTYFPRAAFRCADDTALRWVRSDATEAKV